MNGVLHPSNQRSGKRTRVWWIEWGDQPPFGFYVERWLTWKQRERMRHLANKDSLTSAVEYAKRVGLP